MVNGEVKSYLGIEKSKLVGVLLEIKPSGYLSVYPWILRNKEFVTRAGKDFRDPFVPVEVKESGLAVRWIRGEWEANYNIPDKDQLLKLIEGKLDGYFVISLEETNKLDKSQKEKFLALIRRGICGAMGNR